MVSPRWQLTLARRGWFVFLGEGCVGTAAGSLSSHTSACTNAPLGTLGTLSTRAPCVRDGVPARLGREEVLSFPVFVGAPRMWRPSRWLCGRGLRAGGSLASRPLRPLMWARSRMIFPRQSSDEWDGMLACARADACGHPCSLRCSIL
jgi:hypothetical protein